MVPDGEVEKGQEGDRIRVSQMKSSPKEEVSIAISGEASPDMAEDRAPESHLLHSGPRTPASPRPIGGGDDEEDEEDEEIYKKIELSRKNPRRVRKLSVFQLFVFLAISSCLLAIVSIERLRRSVIWKLELWKWCLLAMEVFSGLFLVRSLMCLVLFLIERNFFLKKKVLYLFQALKRSVQAFVWISMVFGTWVSLFNHGVERSKIAAKTVNLVSSTLVALLVGSFLWVLKTLCLTILTSRLHLNAYFDRIQESLFHQYVIQTLSGPPLIEMMLTFDSSSRVTKKVKSSRITIATNTNQELASIHPFNRENVSAWTVKVMVDGLTDSSLLISCNASDEFDDATDREISNEMEAIAAGYHIFKNVVQPGSKYIDEDDLSRFLNKEQVDMVFHSIDRSDMGRIDKRSLIDWVAKVFRQRRVLAYALTDTKAAIKQLNTIVSGMLFLVSIVIWLLLLKITTAETLALFLTAIGFTFGNTCKSLVESAIFVFVVHPYDVGDRCVIDGVQLVVEEMDIVTTVFLKVDNEKVYYPNSFLATKAISNYNRSPDMGDSVEFTIDFAIPLEKIQVLKERIKKYIEMNPQHWYPTHNLVVKETENESKLKVTLYCNHTMNFQEFGEKNRRRTELIIEMKKIFEELNVRSNLMPQETPLSRLDSVNRGDK
ncbi:hypothetical protein DM860_008203 [Cuscuta australis]|uniref:Mechanosensitive ion channel MscS domain-containing protein n=1 Tax=Cuscuta australis TaxID=267555 RepID=A0A328D7X8_9ASTE|nr:hypothetical protein DM860_008203 [Cuscuta australis]